MWLWYIKVVAAIKAERLASASHKQYLDEVIAKGGPDWQYLKRRITVAAYRGRRSCTFPSWWDAERKEWAALYARQVQGIHVYYNPYLYHYPVLLSW